MFLSAVFFSHVICFVQLPIHWRCSFLSNMCLSLCFVRPDGGTVNLFPDHALHNNKLLSHIVLSLSLSFFNLCIWGRMYCAGISSKLSYGLVSILCPGEGWCIHTVWMVYKLNKYAGTNGSAWTGPNHEDNRDYWLIHHTRTWHACAQTTQSGVWRGYGEKLSHCALSQTCCKYFRPC